MNPPHAGHAELVDRVHSVARARNGESRIYLSTAQKSPLDPLPFDRKMHYIRHSFPDAAFRQPEGQGNEPWDSLTRVWQDGFEHLVVVCGSDRTLWFGKILRELNGTPRFNFKLITLSSVHRPTSPDGTLQVSGTHLRSKVQHNDYRGFAALLAPGLPEGERRMMFEELRAALKADAD